MHLATARLLPSNGQLGVGYPNLNAANSDWRARLSIEPFKEDLCP